ncbi:MAG: hypothetical protein HC892_10735 [Saprospiraceae bacterium]|nr:hypothetical protein [Saprospiraceae bacterium]
MLMSLSQTTKRTLAGISSSFTVNLNEGAPQISDNIAWTLEVYERIKNIRPNLKEHNAN